MYSGTAEFHLQHIITKKIQAVGDVPVNNHSAESLRANIKKHCINCLKDYQIDGGFNIKPALKECRDLFENYHLVSTQKPIQRYVGSDWSTTKTANEQDSQSLLANLNEFDFWLPSPRGYDIGSFEKFQLSTQKDNNTTSPMMPVYMGHAIDVVEEFFRECLVMGWQKLYDNNLLSINSRNNLYSVCLTEYDQRRSFRLANKQQWVYIVIARDIKHNRYQFKTLGKNVKKHRINTDTNSAYVYAAKAISYWVFSEPDVNFLNIAL